MTPETRPTADELGISDVEYERILRGLERRDAAGEPAGSGPGGTTSEAPPHPRRPAWASLLLLCASALLLVLLRQGGGGSDEPAHAFLHEVNGTPITYSSCKQIPVEVYPAGGPPNAEALVREAVAIVRRASGLDIVVTGAFGGHATNWNFQDSDAIRADDPVSVSWQDGSAIERLSGEVLGLGGSSVFTRRSTGQQRLAAGAIALSREDYALWTRTGNEAEQLGVLLHEFGHVLGLDHVDSRGELMYPEAIGRSTFGPGDLEGLRALGQGPCL